MGRMALSGAWVVESCGAGPKGAENGDFGEGRFGLGDFGRMGVVGKGSCSWGLGEADIEGWGAGAGAFNGGAQGLCRGWVLGWQRGAWSRD